MIQQHSSNESTLPLHIKATKYEFDDLWPQSPSQNDSDYDQDNTPFWQTPPLKKNKQTKGDELPQWSANPQSPSDDRSLSPETTASSNLHPYKVVPNLSSGNFQPAKVPLFLLSLVAFGFVALLTSRVAVHTAEEQLTMLQHNRDEMEDNLKRAEREVRVLKRELTAMDVMIRQRQLGNDNNSNDGSNDVALSSRNTAILEMNELQQQLMKEAKQVQTMKEKVQLSSKESVLQKYGDRIHHVEIELIFPDRQEGPHKFVIELAPLDTVPHSIHTFLEMVSNGLLDGCSFILNALHVLKAAPLPYDGTSAADKARAFSELGLESVSFKEYSESYPHRQYTVGFAADGSPSFYINTEDNTEIHVGDPCFGRVVEGFDAIRRLEASPTRNGIWFERRIGIKQARIIQ